MFIVLFFGFLFDLSRRKRIDAIAGITMHSFPILSQVTVAKRRK